MASDLSVRSALVIGLVGLMIPALLTVLLVFMCWKSSDISALISPFIGVVGTLVGSFLGVKVGAAGKEKAEQLTYRALAKLDPAAAKDVLQG